MPEVEIPENIKCSTNIEEVVKESGELVKTKQELEETTDRLKRIMAEFENYKKRSSKEKEMLYNSILSDIISSFLPVIDNLEKSLADLNDDYDKAIAFINENVNTLVLDRLTEKNIGIMDMVI